MLDKIRGLIAARNTHVAVDLGTTAIKIAKIKSDPRGTSIQELHNIPLPQGMLAGWLNGENDDLTVVLRRAVLDLKLEGNKVVTTLPGDKIITRHIQMPSMPLEEMKRALKWEANRLIPIPLNDMIVRHVKLREAFVDGIKKISLLLIACSSGLLYRYHKTFERAGLRIASLDLQALALWRLFTDRQWNLTSGHTTAVADVGAGYCHLVVISGGRVGYTRNFPVNINYRVKEENLKELVTELERSFEFYNKHSREPSVGDLALCGGGSKIDYLREYIAGNMNATVRGFDLFEPAYVVAVGLALRGRESNV